MTGLAPVSALIVRDGEIVEPPLPDEMLFTKEQVIEILSEHGLDSEISRAVEKSEKFREMWDATDKVVYNDPALGYASAESLITGEVLYTIKEAYKEKI